MARPPRSRRQSRRLARRPNQVAALRLAVHLLAKRALTAVMYFFTLADTGDSGRLPLITIPAQ